MLSRVFPIIRYNYAAKVTVPLLISKIQIYKFPELHRSVKSQNMSTVHDEILNDPSRNLDYAQLIEKKKNPKIMLIDVRESDEIKETGKLPGSIHIPLKEIEKVFKDMTNEDFYKVYKTQKPDQDTQIIFSCRSGKRSMTALRTALTLGYKNAAHYKGGWLDWAENTRSSKN